MRIITGIQPTGELHLGNFFGAIKPLVEFQKNNECFIFVADLHALTIPQNPDQLRTNTLKVVGDYLALGIDPKKCVIFIQSQVPAHAELTWILATLTPLGELNRMTQFKEKSKVQKTNINAGLYTYPVLMAADVLLYQVDAVPVGEDQRQHLELTREIARKFNHHFGKTFKIPSAILPKLGARIMALTDPTKKMAKSLGPESFLGIFDPPEQIKQKIKKAVTDSGREVKYNPKTKPAISNLLTIFSLVSGQNIPNLEKKFRHQGYAEFKKALTEALLDFLEPFQKKRPQITEGKIKQIIKLGQKKASAVAQKTIKDVKRKVGLVP